MNLTQYISGSEIEIKINESNSLHQILLLDLNSNSCNDILISFNGSNCIYSSLFIFNARTKSFHLTQGFESDSKGGAIPLYFEGQTYLYTGTDISSNNPIRKTKLMKVIDQEYVVLDSMVYNSEENLILEYTKNDSTSNMEYNFQSNAGCNKFWNEVVSKLKY